MNKSRFMNNGVVDHNKVLLGGDVYEMHSLVTSGKAREPLMSMGASANPVLAAMMNRGGRGL